MATLRQAVARQYKHGAQPMHLWQAVLLVLKARRACNASLVVRTADEILGAKRFLADSCGIQESEIRGFRSPYLVTNPTGRAGVVSAARSHSRCCCCRCCLLLAPSHGMPLPLPFACWPRLASPHRLISTPLCLDAVRQVLFENGFLFDSTLLELGQSESVSTSFANRVWPCALLAALLLMGAAPPAEGPADGRRGGGACKQRAIRGHAAQHAVSLGQG